jgi:hypothetical protein
MGGTHLSLLFSITSRLFPSLSVARLQCYLFLYLANDSKYLILLTCTHHAIYGKNPTDKEKESLLTIQQLLLYNDLTFFNSCTTGKTDLNITRKVMQGRKIRGQPGVHRLIPPKARTSARINGYVYRTVCNYNALPLDIKTCLSKAFKDSCMKHVMGHAN